jgi:hypothetical protein
MSTFHRTVVRTQLALHRAVAGAARRGERGDVPGWVLVTLMTAGLVAALWAVAEGQLKALFSEALDSARR